MIVSKDDLENVVQNAVNRLLEKRENKPEVYLSVEETARRLKVDRSTLWRWNKDGYLTTTKVGNKVRYKLSDVERIQKGEVYEWDKNYRKRNHGRCGQADKSSLQVSVSGWDIPHNDS